MSVIQIVKRSEEDKTIDVTSLDFTQDEAYSFIENISERLLVSPSVKYYVVDLQKFKTSATDMISVIKNQEKDKYVYYSIFELKR